MVINSDDNAFISALIAGTPKIYELKIKDKEEVLLALHTGKKINGGNLFLTSKLLQAMFTAMKPESDELTESGEPKVKVKPEEVLNALRSFYPTIDEYQEGSDILDTAYAPKEVNEAIRKGSLHWISLETPLAQGSLFDREIRLMVFVIGKWLNPHLRVAEPDIVITQTRVNDWMKYRFKQMSVYPEFDSAGFGTVYCSEGILSLCWAEIFDAIEKKLIMGVCPFCWSTFEYSKYNLKKNHCRKGSCLNEYRKSVYGKHCEAEWKKKKVTGRKPGRPKKDSDPK